MVQRVIDTLDVVSEAVRKPTQVDLDKQSQVTEVGFIPNALRPYCSVTEYGDNLVHRTVIDLVNAPVTITDDPGVAQYGGTGAVYQFPEGLIFSKAAILTGTLTLGTTGTIIDAFNGVNALGSAAAGTGATLTGTEATWLQSTANSAAVSKSAAVSSISAATALTETTVRTIDGTGTPAQVFLNFAIADDVSHTSGSGQFTGRIQISWEKIGDR